MTTSSEEHSSEAHASEEHSVDSPDIPWSDSGRIVASGFAMGSADVVPGVSGGTLAVACGIYEELLAAIDSVDLDVVKAALRLDLKTVLAKVHFRFLACLLGGIATAVVVMIKIVGLPKLLISHPREVYAVFFGLVLASVFILGRKISWNFVRAGSLALGTLLGFLVVNLVPVSTPSNPLFMFGYGMVAISAMLLPGISGSFILLILGQYERVIGALESLIHLELSALGIVLPFAAGCLLGIGAFSRFVAWLLRHFHDPVVAGLCGLLLGSLWRIWPYQNTVTQVVRGKTRVLEATPYLPPQFDLGILALLVAGFLAVFLVEFLAHLRSQPRATS